MDNALQENKLVKPASVGVYRNFMLTGRLGAS